MATTENLVFGDGGDTYSFSFPYLKTEDVRVELQEYDSTQPVGDQIISRSSISAFTIPAGNPTQIIFNAIGADTVYQTAPDGDVKVTSTNGYPVRIRIYRATQPDATPATFFAGSAIRAQDLNDNFDQILYIMQENENSLISIQTGGIGDNVISTSAILDDAVDATKLRDSVSDDSIRAVTTNHIRDNAITTAKLNDSSVTTAKLDDSSVTSAKIVDGTIVNADVNASAAIDATKLSFTQSGTGATARTIDSKLADVVSVKDFGAVGDDVTNDTAAIQAAIDAVNTAGGGTVYFPQGSYVVSANLSIYSKIKYLGAGSKASILRVSGTPGPVSIFRTTSSVNGVVFDSLGFSGSVNYPADSTVYKQTYANTNTAIQTSGGVVTDFLVQNCDFRELSAGSIDINGAQSSNIKIVNNSFYKGSYCSHVINVHHQSSQTEANRLTDVVITGNTFDTCGPEYHYDPSKEDWIVSTNCIIVDRIKHGTIANNIAKNVSDGIRVEDSKNVSVTGNVVIESGGSGITVYKYCSDCSVTGNVIQNWGRIPFVYAVRNYSGTYVVARESPNAVNAPLPADPTVSTWFDTWPYALTNVNTANIITYSDSDYYTAPSSGILPFRGYAAISYVTESHNVTVTGNTILGDITQVGGLYVYACDFGVTPVHPVNSPTGVLPGQGCVVTGNSISDALYKSHYHPEDEDPINGNNPTGVAVYGPDKETSVNVAEKNFHVASGVRSIGVNRVEFPATPVYSSDPNHLDTYAEGTWIAQLSPASGSITMEYYHCRYTRIGNLVQVTGQITALSVNSPTGVLSINLPFTSAPSSAGRNAITAHIITASGFTGSPVGSIELSILGGSNTGTFYLLGTDFTRLDVSSYVQAGTTFTLNFSYLVT